MSAEARALLDQLMGAERDVAEEEKTGKGIMFHDDQVCKYHLCGINLMELFRNTKSDLVSRWGPYHRKPVPGCKEQWEALSQAEKDKYGYEYDLMQKLAELVRECDRKVSRGRARVAEQERELASYGTADDKEEEQKVMTEKCEELNTQAEAAGEEGDVEKAMGLMEQAKALKTQLEQMKLVAEQAEKEAKKYDKKLVLCEVTGNFLSSTDSDERVR